MLKDAFPCTGYNTVPEMGNTSTIHPKNVHVQSCLQILHIEHICEHFLQTFMFILLCKV